MGGEIQLDWLHVIIPIGNKRVKLESGEKEKYSMMNFDNPKAQILYQELEFKKSIIFSDSPMVEEEPDPPDGPCM